MKKWPLILSVALNVLLLVNMFVGRQRLVNDFTTRKVGRFSIMQNIHQKDFYIVAFDDGSATWTIDGHMQCIDIWKSATFSLWLDANTGQLSKTVLELRDVRGKPVYYSDINGDGITDMRHYINPNITQYFVNGQFYEAGTENNHTYIIKDGQRVVVEFQNGRWVILP